MAKVSPVISWSQWVFILRETQELWAALSGEPVPESMVREHAVQNLKKAMISWAQIARWLKSQAPDPGEAPQSSIKPQDWALD